ncbi:MAG: hypothetical protein ACT4UQ_01555, partial [Gammaproteobacteria bacterium]
MTAMADPGLREEEALPPPVAPLLGRAEAGWLAPLREDLARMRGQGRMPHGLLLVGPPGAGQQEIGVWL